MANRLGLLSILAGLALATPASAIPTTSDDCSVLDWAFREARTEFPALKNRQFGGALCTYGRNEFKCEWGFPTDRYGDAELQIDRLERCTAAQPNAKLIVKGPHQAVFLLDPDTKVLIRGPDPYNGDWGIQLKFTTTASWN